METKSAETMNTRNGREDPTRSLGRSRRRIAPGKNGTCIPPVPDRGAAVAARKATNQRTAEIERTGQKIPGERDATPPARGLPKPPPHDRRGTTTGSRTR